MKESEIVDKIKTYLKGVDGLFCFKEHGGIYGVSGIPDIICCYKGRFIGFEVKTETGKLTVLQAVTLRQIERAGGVAEVVRSVDEVKAILNKLQNNSNGGI